MDADTNLTHIRLSDQTRLADVVWDSVPLTRASWDDVRRLGDESRAWRRRDIQGERKDKKTREEEFRAAIRAYRQLAVVLRAQGLNEPADKFTYRAHVLQRQVLRRQNQWHLVAGNRFLDLIAGYGYKPARSFAVYLLVLCGFAVAYFAATNSLLGFGAGATQVQPLHWYEALVLSVSAFHGRGFFQPVQNLGDPVAILAAIEAVMGLFIEITFIATFTQRFFAR
jgi:hypothetical protein